MPVNSAASGSTKPLRLSATLARTKAEKERRNELGRKGSIKGIARRAAANETRLLATRRADR